MTREQAIKVLNMVEAHGSLVIQAKEMAIKALEQEPCEDDTWSISEVADALERHGIMKREPCEDVISRQAAIDAVEKTKAAMSTDGEIYVAKINAEMNIQLLQSVSTEKTGHWIFVDKAKEHAHCSECDYGNVDLFDGRPHNYCPNCGAKMEV